jgi:uncharacterized membrane protein YhaH (DUF805 family)
LLTTSGKKVTEPGAPASAAPDWVLTGLPIAIAVLKYAYLVWVCLHVYVDVPFGDQWELVPRLNHLDAGTFGFNDVWRQHNEHRPMFPILVMIGLAQATGWNIGAEIALNLVLGAAIFAVLVLAVRQLRDVPWRWWWLAVMACLLFSLDQWENWLWGWQMQIFMGVLATTIGFWALSGPNAPNRRLAIALAAGIFGTYSFSSGLTTWVVALLAFAFNHSLRSTSRIVIWVAVAAATIASYFIDYHLPPGHPSMLSNFASLHAFSMFVLYVLKYLGAPVAGYIGEVSALAGAIGIGLFGGLLGQLWRDRAKPVYLFACLMGLNALADAVMTGLGRAGFGTDQAMSSRYLTIGLPLWLAIGFLVCLTLTDSAAGVKSTRRLVVAAGAALVVASVMLTGHKMFLGGAARMRDLGGLRIMLYEGRNWKAMTQLYLPDEALMRERRGQLRMLRLSVFRDN